MALQTTSPSGKTIQDVKCGTFGTTATLVHADGTREAAEGSFAFGSTLSFNVKNGAPHANGFQPRRWVVIEGFWQE